MYKNLYKPGTNDHEAGKFVEVGPRGGKIKNARETKTQAGHKLPPTSEGGHLWKEVK